MTNPDTPNDGIDWSQLGNQFKGTTERAEAGDERRLTEESKRLKGLLGKVLPPDQMARLESQGQDAQPLLADDGEPIVTTQEAAGLVALARPNIGELMSQTAYSKTLVRQQQLALDIDISTEAGDVQGLEELGKKRTELNAEVRRIEFWSVVVALHPIHPEYMRDATPGRLIKVGDDHLSQVEFILDLEDDYAKLADFNDLWTPGQIDVQREAAKTDPSAPRWAGEWVDQMQKQAEDNHIKMRGYAKILTDVVYGRTNQGREGVAPASHNKIAEKSVELDVERPAHREILSSLPGIDPVPEILAGRLRDLPEDGWLIISEVEPPNGRSELSIIEYKDRGLRFNDSHTGSKGSYISLGMKALGDKHSRYWAVYGRQEKRGGHDLPMEDGKLLKSGYLLDLEHDQYGSITLDEQDKSRRANASRITSDPAEARVIIRSIGQAMGMSDKEAGVLLGTTKHAFKELMTEDERKAGLKRLHDLEDSQVSEEEWLRWQREIDNPDLYNEETDDGRYGGEYPGEDDY